MVQVKLCLDEDTKLSTGMNIYDVIRILQVYCNKHNYILDAWEEEGKEELKYVDIYKSEEEQSKGFYMMRVATEGTVVTYMGCPIGESYVEINDKKYDVENVLDEFKDNIHNIGFCWELDEHVDCKQIKEICNRAKDKGCNENCSKFSCPSISVDFDLEHCGILSIVINELNGKQEFMFITLEI